LETPKHFCPRARFRSKPQIDEVIATAGQLAEKNKNRLIVDAQENLGALTADSLRLKQIPLNLLSVRPKTF
jgi:hypothetical protein